MVEILVVKEYRERFSDEQFSAIFEAISRYHNNSDLDVPNIRRVLQLPGWILVDVDTYLKYQYPRKKHPITIAIKI